MTQEKTPQSAKPVAKIDFAKPHFVTVRQTETRNIIAVTPGDEKAADMGLSAVIEEAREEAARLKSPVLVFGPQVGVIEPPVPSPPQFVGMKFGEN